MTTLHARWRAILAGQMLPYAVIILLSVVLFSPFIFRGKIFLAADILFTNYPWEAQAPPGFKPHNDLISDPVNHNWAGIYNRQLHQGGLKNWNPYILTGVPNTGLTAMSGMSGRWYPLKLLCQRLFSAPVALSLLLFIHVTLMGLTMFLYLAQIGAGGRGALLGAVAFMFNGCAMAWLEYESVVYASALLPLLLFCLERLRRGRIWLWTAVGAGVMGLCWLMSHLQYMVYLHILVGFYCLLLLWRALRQGAPRRDLLALLAAFAAVIAVGALIGAIEILPTLEVLRSSNRNLLTYTYGEFFQKIGRIPWRQLVTLIFPNYFGNPILGFTALSTPPSQGLMMFNELAVNVGIPTFLAFLGAIVAPKTSRTRFFLAMTLLSLLLMTGTSAAYPFFRFVPGMDKMTPTRIAWLFTFSACAAAGLGFRKLERLRRGRKAAYVAILLLLAVAVIIFSLVSARPSVISCLNAERVLADRPEPADILDRLKALRSITSPVILKPLFLTAASVILFVLLVRARSAHARFVIFGGLLGLLASELIGGAAAYNTTVAPEMVYPKTPAIEFLQRQPRPFRVAMIVGLGETCFNTLAPFGIQDVGGYSSIFPIYNSDLLSLIQFPAGTGFSRWAFFRRPQSRLFDLLNVEFVLTARSHPVFSSRFQLVHQGEINIYKNLGAQPRAFATHQAVFALGGYNGETNIMNSSDFDFRNTVLLHEWPDEAFLRGVGVPDRPPTSSFISYDADDIAVEADLSTAGWLVLSDAFYPGWEATVDGRPAPIQRANISCRAVALPAGRHRVDFRYRPASLRWGRLLTTVGACLVLAGLTASFMAGRGSRASASSTLLASEGDCR